MAIQDIFPDQLQVWKEVVDEYGAIFIERLQYSPREIEDIVNELLELFEEVERYALKEDALEFYQGLSKDGFLNESEKLEDFKADGFDYSTLKGSLCYKNILLEMTVIRNIFG